MTFVVGAAGGHGRRCRGGFSGAPRRPGHATADAAGASVTAITLIMMHSRDGRSRSQPVSATVTAKRATARPSTDRLGAKKDGGVAGETLGAGTSLLVSLYEGGCCMSESV